MCFWTKRLQERLGPLRNAGESGEVFLWGREGRTSVRGGPWDPWVLSGPVCVTVSTVPATPTPPTSLQLPPISPSLFLHHLPQTMFICFSSRSLGSLPTLPPFFFRVWWRTMFFAYGKERGWVEKNLRVNPSSVSPWANPSLCLESRKLSPWR